MLRLRKSLSVLFVVDLVVRMSRANELINNSMLLVVLYRIEKKVAWYMDSILYRIH